MEVIDPSQSGGIPRSRQQLKLLLTCYTLDQLVPLWVRRAVPVLLSDYRKAFDLIDHQILLSKIQIFLRCEIFHFALPDYLNADLEPVQKRVTSIIFPSLPMTNAYKNAVLFPFRIVAKMLVESCSTKSSTILLSPLLAERSSTEYNLRNRRVFHHPKTKMNRFSNTFIPACVQNFSCLIDACYSSYTQFSFCKLQSVF